MKNLRNKR
ncbi:hypothetical protein MTR67_051860 [Solanum verrucosum]|uniref:Uncharacterized protein n=1 Tax=Solanum verrucosum TaxID=315347 RepID=A0AAF1A2T5_SOLVR|nr:hypothetical protein MTR67_051860 [Solanum verrucosum]